MLKRLAILNSTVYGKAEITLDDCSSLQLVGSNNVGKSTLIYALNFLFIIDGNKMTFSGNRKGDKETINHYFPSVETSYIIFEIFKQRRYCILVKRNSDHELEYFKIDSEYREDLFFQQVDGKQTLLKFEQVKENITVEGINWSHFKNKTEVFNAVYQRGRRNDAVVWLEDSVKSDGLSNNFSKIYRYLINSKLITNKTLKDALIIADSREGDGLNFSQKSKQEISSLLKQNAEIKAIQAIKNDFEIFRESVRKFKSLSEVVSEYICAFNHAYSPTIIELETLSFQKAKELTSTSTRLHEELKPRAEELNRQIGGKKVSIEAKEKECGRLEDEIEEIKRLEPLEFLKASLENLDQERKELEASLTRIESMKLSSNEIQRRISSISKEVGTLENQINNYSRQLIHQITARQEDKELLNFILSPEFSSLPADLILKKVEQLSGTMKIFDGEIKVPEGKFKEIDSIEDLKESLRLKQKELQDYQALLPKAQDLESANLRLKDFTLKINEIQRKLALIGSLPLLTENLTKAKEELCAYQEAKDKLDTELKVTKEEIFRNENALEEIKRLKLSFDSKATTYKEYKKEIEALGLEGKEFSTTDSLEKIYISIKQFNSQRETIKSSKNNLFEKLKDRINSAIADEETFIKFVEEEIACLHEKEKSIESLLQTISTQFANPALNLLRRYEEFKLFISNRFNTKLSKTKISDIEDLRIEINDNKKLLDEIRTISSIQDLQNQLFFDFNHSDNLRLLNAYLDAQKKIDFEDLFDIELNLTVKGKNKRVDLKDQVESDGTDRMIRLVIIMTIINRLSINTDQNKVVLFVDEIGTIDEKNRIEIIQFCRDHNFIPISAAPLQPYEGFDKYYFLSRSSSGKVNVNDKQHSMKKEMVFENEAN